MADVDSTFDFLHMEIVGYFHREKQGRFSEADAMQKLEKMGFNVGQRLVERFTKDSPRFKDELDIMKYVCKDFWTAVFKRQVDNLRTNHQGVYVLQDNKFRVLTQMSEGKQYTEVAPKFLAFPCGMIRGGLANLGITCTVSADVLPMPACRFQIVIQRT
ncbi:trafficking protein particle complex subunit 6b [Nematostella vectensis]|uniref:trafficking protein particle complex subunit 6b n=1 Tax=Nematostella vectensis TaxID=45351 RepID=UPI00138FBA0B|nr:trafficking protein particle complex subunit 6b [Nematostella vectensis]